MKRDLIIRAVVCAVVLSSAAIAVAQDSAKKAAVSNLVRTLGYGGAIHNLGNYVLRGDQKYHDTSRVMFERAAKTLDSLGKMRGLTADEKAALAALTDAVGKYRAQLPNIERLKSQGKTVEQIDAASAVDDASALDAIDALRNQHQWNDLEELDFQIGYGGGIHSFANFVLRADEEYRARAAAGLSKVLLTVARYRDSDDLSEAKAKALDKIESVVRHYEEALVRVQKLIGEGKTAKEINAVVKVDDTPALEGLATLRK